MSKTTIPAGGLADSAVTTAKINADAVTDSKSLTLEVMAIPETKGDPTFCTPPPLTEATANSAIDPCPKGISLLMLSLLLQELLFLFVLLVMLL